MTATRRPHALAATAALVAAPLLAAPADAAVAPDISLTGVQGHVSALQQIADANGGNRAVGTPGYQRSLDYVKGQLEAAGLSTTVQQVPTSRGTTYNLVAEVPGSDPNGVVMLGSHLDGATAGPGINDNASGTAGVLETALTYAASGEKPRNTLRFAFWGAEEIGLVGSSYYVQSLTSTERSRIKAYVNADMIGSVNPGYFVYDDNPAGTFVRDDLTSLMSAEGVPAEYVDVQGRSDHAAFLRYGIPTGGLYSGGSEPKSAAQANSWGGTAGASFDPCYHRSCDDSSNIDPTALDRHSDVLGGILWKYAGQDFTTSAQRPAA